MSVGNLGDYFGACDVLTLDTRLELAELLAVPGEPTALAGNEVSRLAMPETRELLDEVRAAISHGLTLGMMTTLADRRVVDVLPAISRAPVRRFDTAMSVRLRAALTRKGTDSWESLAHLKLGDIGRLTNVGPRSLLTLLHCGLAAEFECVDSADAPMPPGDINALLAYEAEVGSTALADALDGLATGSGSPAIRAAASRLRADAGVGRSLTLLERALDTAGDARDRAGGQQERSRRRQG